MSVFNAVKSFINRSISNFEKPPIVRQEKFYYKEKPILARQPSKNVAHQISKDCWNYTACRIIMILICNVINLEELDNKKCDEIYLNLDSDSDTFLKNAKQHCITDDNDSSYKKYYYIFSY